MYCWDLDHSRCASVGAINRQTAHPFLQHFLPRARVGEGARDGGAHAVAPRPELLPRRRRRPLLPLDTRRPGEGGAEVQSYKANIRDTDNCDSNQ